MVEVVGEGEVLTRHIVVELLDVALGPSAAQGE